MNTPPGLPPVRPIPIKDRASFVFVQYGQVDVIDGAFVVLDDRGVRTQIPVGGITCVFLEPGTRISHAAVALAARTGTLLVWVGEAGVRLYAVGQPGGARSDHLLWQARLAADDTARLNVVRKMYEIRFGMHVPERRSIDQLRGIEAGRMKESYKLIAKQFGVDWGGRHYTPGDFDTADLQNRCLSQATSCLYGVCEAAILAAGYAPAIGFIHSGKPKSFVYDIADLMKVEIVIPIAFKVYADAMNGKGMAASNPMGEVRRQCRDAFRRSRLLSRVIPVIEEVLEAGGLMRPEAPEEAMPVAFIEEQSGDDGHRG